MAIPNLDQAIQSYADALKQWVESNTNSGPNTPSSTNQDKTISESSLKPTDKDILTVLVARDHVQSAYIAHIKTPNGPPPSGITLAHLSQLDQDLQKLTTTSFATTQLANWRSSFALDDNVWWWSWLNPKPEQTDRFQWLWQAATVYTQV